MVLEKGVASWWFKDESETVFYVDKDTFAKLAEMTMKVTSVLVDNELFVPEKVVFFNRWHIYKNKKYARSFGKEIEPLYCVAADACRLHDLILERVLNEQSSCDFSFPAQLEVIGQGIIRDCLGRKQQQANAVSIWSLFMDVATVNVITHSDAWLPYTIGAIPIPQPEVYENNAPLLEKALLEIENKLGWPGDGLDSSFCAINGYRLENLRDGFGDLLAVDENGHIL